MIESQLEIIEQAIIYLQSVNNDDYNQVMTPNFKSSAGSHIRHIIDHYESVRKGCESGIVDYNKRSRGAEVESNPLLAIKKLTSIANWISELKSFELNKKLTLITEISVIRKQVVNIDSNLARELIFSSNHAIHHYAIISQIIKTISANNNQNKNYSPMPNNFGIAPATATFLRDSLEQSVLLNSKKTPAQID